MTKDSNGRYRFFDDCGFYSANRCHKFYLLKPELSHVYLKNDKWFSDIHHKKQITISNDKFVFEICVFIGGLKSNLNFKRRITRIIGAEFALIEYIGKFDVKLWLLYTCMLI